ncbi:MAG: hypothetical protein Q7U60_01095 [Candidatus Methanoperedens sp.]|nr:hypothetical protein [Candidatus Methanoperedens sp.]
MKRTKLLIITVVFVIIALNIAYFTLNYTKEGNALIATKFIKNEATYKFDGIPETFKLSETIPSQCPYCWEFTFEYQSGNSGYGDRKNTSVDAVITNHSAKIVLEKGNIQSAVLDNTWDMKAQKPLNVVPREGRGRRR